MAAWTPANLSGVLVWLDAADTSTITLDGSNVAAWASKVGGKTVAAPSGSRPTYSASGRNGLPTITFAPNQYLTTTDVSGLPMGNTPSVLVAVAYLDAGGNQWTPVLSYGVSAGGQERSIFSNANSRTVGFSAFAGDFSSGVPWTDDRVVVTNVADGAANSIKQYVDGNPTSYNYTYNFNTNATNAALSVGKHATGGDYWRGTAQELLILSGTISAADRIKLEGYLAWKWGKQGNLPADHTYRNAAPTDGATAPPSNCQSLLARYNGQWMTGRLWFQRNGTWQQATQAYARANGAWQLICADGAVVTTNNVLMESGDTFTLESGDTLVLEG